MNAQFSNLRVLIVDDNTHMRTLLRSLLQALGVTHIYEAPDGAQGFAIMRDFKPDVILSDMTMQPVNGIEFTRMVRTRRDSPNQFVPVIMVTGQTERSMVMAARDAGVSEFIAKPVTAQSLTSRLTEATQRPRPFIRSDNYVGPDRRRRRSEDHEGPWRRVDDKGKQRSQ
jgi:two-component system, chemotaxis family, chemotaxis protein CheY